MSKLPPPLLGFNNNVRHRGRVFHIQTEDSGVTRARLVTHLFADGGRIIKTARTDYSEHLDRADMTPVVRRLMKEQHKGMFIRLRSGELDDAIVDACGAYDDEVVPTRTPTPPPAAPSPPPLARPSERAEKRLSNPALRRVVPSIPPPAGDLELDVGSLDAYDPGVAQSVDPRRAAALARPRPSAAPPELGEPPLPGSPPSSPPDDALGRYAASRPATIFGDIPISPRSIFGSDPISEQSLDEVILSYLAEDLDGGSQD